MDGGGFELRITGSAHYKYDYTLPAGNHIMSWPSNAPINVETVIGDQTSNVENIKNNAGDIYASPLFTGTGIGFNGIGNLKPGQGYQIKVADGKTFKVEVTNSIGVEGCTDNRPGPYPDVFGNWRINTSNQLTRGYKVKNYNPNATIDDGSCIVMGCTNPNATNYDPSANHDDGTCFLPQSQTYGQVIKLPPENMSKEQKVFFISSYIDFELLSQHLNTDLEYIFSNAIYAEDDTTSTSVIFEDIVREVKDQTDGTSFVTEFSGSSTIGDYKIHEHI